MPPDRSFEALRKAIREEVARLEMQIVDIREQNGSALVTIERTDGAAERELHRVRWVQHPATDSELWWSFLGTAE